MLNGSEAMHTKATKRRTSPIPIGRGKESGCAFSIDNALLAMRWAGLVQGRGYCLTFSHAFENAEEVIEIHIPPYETPIARIHRGNRVLWLTDCTGHNRAFTTLADALTSVASLSARETRIMLRPRIPCWLWTANGQAGSDRSAWLQVKRIGAVWIQMLQHLMSAARGAS